MRRIVFSVWEEAPSRRDRMMAFLRCIALVTGLAAAPANAQVPEGMDFPDRAVALRPTGMICGRASWETTVLHPVYGVVTDHAAGHTFEARIPYGSLLIEVAMSGILSWSWPELDDPGVLFETGNPELGAAFRDAPAPGWRFEIGGAITIPISQVLVLDSIEPRFTTGDFPPGSFGVEAPMNTDWNLQRRIRNTFTLLARAHGEFDPIPEIVLGLELVLPLYVAAAEQRVFVYPRVALEGAYRWAFSLVGLRVELATFPLSYGFAYSEWIDFLLEPFVRYAFSDIQGTPYLRASLRVPVGPSVPFIGSEPVGVIGAALEIGTLF
jgi:hypothetical protein